MDWRTRSVAFRKVSRQSENAEGRDSLGRRTHIDGSEESRVHGDIEALGEEARTRCRELHCSLICLRYAISTDTHDSARLAVHFHCCIPLYELAQLMVSLLLCGV